MPITLYVKYGTLVVYWARYFEVSANQGTVLNIRKMILITFYVKYG